MNDARRFGNTIKRLPIVFCLDVSPSMGWDIDNRDIIPMELLNNSVNTFIREINSDGRTRSSAEVSYVTFSTDIEVDSPFIPARNLDNIHLRPVSEGGTNMAQAVLRSYQKLEERVNEYVRSGIRFNVPFFVLVTDGNPDDNDDGDNGIVDAHSDKAGLRKEHERGCPDRDGQPHGRKSQGKRKRHQFRQGHRGGGEHQHHQQQEQGHPWTCLCYGRYSGCGGDYAPCYGQAR